MKKLLSLLLVLGLLVSLTGCDSLLFDLAVSPTEDTSVSVTDEVLADITDPVTEAPTEEPEPTQAPTEAPTEAPQDAAPDVNGTYTTKEDVAAYIYHYHRLPKNFITKNQARDLGWKSGSLEAYAPGMCIGGDHFGNYEGILPKAPGRKYTECDIDTLGAKSRGAKRIVFSNDGLIYYTDDHYESFTLLYGEE